MVPERVLALDALPLTANGKVDRRALEALAAAGRTATGRVAPRTPLEEAIAHVWSEALDGMAVGAEDDYFLLGGDSVLATVIVGRLRDGLGTDAISVRDVLTAHTVAGLAARLGGREGAQPRLEQAARAVSRGRADDRRGARGATARRRSVGGAAMSVAVQSTAWLRCYEPRPDASGRIVCFGPAGGAASFFRGWSAHAPADVEVWALAYPGRERRIDEPPLERMEDLADAITGVLAPRIDRPTVLFGHSMGASVAYEVTRRLEARDGRAPAGLVVSARRGPCHQRACPDDTAGLTDAEILGRLRALGGTAAEVLDDPAMHELIVPPCRTDFELLGHYRPQPAPPIGTPLAVVHGDRDPAVPAAEVRSWTQASRHAAGMHVFPGEHFFCVHHEAALVAYVAALLRGEPGAEPAIVKPRRFVRRPAGEPAPAPAYHERRVAFDGDPLAAAVALAECSTLPNVLYERRGAVSWAEGTRVETEVAGDDPPLQHTRAMLAQLELTGWRAYGWAGFDLAHALHGTGGVPAGTPLVRLLIPDREVRLDDGTALLRARDPGDLARLAERLRCAAARRRRRRRAHRRARPGPRDPAARALRTTPPRTTSPRSAPPWPTSVPIDWRR